MKTTTFETAKDGDKVWCMRSGWGEVRRTDRPAVYPIAVYFPNDGFKTYTLGGFYDINDITQSLFWDEIVIEAPTKPLPDLPVDTKVLVWMDDTKNKYCRHFSHFENNIIYVFDGGFTSWTGTYTSPWNHWELAE